MKNKKTIAVDYLLATFKLSPNASFGKKTIELESGITLSLSVNKSDAVKNFRYCYNITIYESQYGKIYVLPSNKSFEKDLRICQIRFNNNIFYSKEFEGILYLLKKCNYLKLNPIRINRLDLALDTSENLTVKLRPFFNSINTDDKKYKVPFNMFCSQGIQGGVPSFQIGANKFINIYNKTKEIRHSSNKLYIQKFHKKNGINGKVTRVEIRLLNTDKKALGYLKTIDFWKLSSTDYLYRIFTDINNKYFFFRHNLKSNSSRNPKEYILTFPDTFDVLKKPKKARKQRIHTNMVKGYLKYLLMTFWLYTEVEYQVMFWALVFAITENNNLQSWLQQELKKQEGFYFSKEMYDFEEKFVSPTEVYAKLREAHFMANNILK
jgi:hypothetical protein